MHRPMPAEGNDLESLLGQGMVQNLQPPQPNVLFWPDEKAAAFCALTPPLETFMVVPSDIRGEQFFNTARQDDVLIGYISAIQDSGLIMTLLCYDLGPRRDLDGLKLTGFIPVRQLPRSAGHGNVLDAYQIGEKIRAFILDVHPSGRLILSMNPKSFAGELPVGLKLGQVTDEDLPLHHKKLQNLDKKSFEACLESTPQFRNPDGLRVLCSRLGISRASTCSLLLSVSKIRLTKSEMACELRRAQLYNLSMKHVTQGVKYFKDGRNSEALQCYNYAIDVENTNPDAYVARGALYASIGTYTKAVEDLEKSLHFQPNHVNAKNYLGQTLVAYACELAHKEPAKADQLLKQALKLDPQNEEAREALRELPGGLVQPIETNIRSWSRSPSPTKSVQSRAGQRRGVGALAGRSPIASPPCQASASVASHMERSRAVLQQLVEEDRSRRASTRREPARSPRTFYSPPGRRCVDERSRDEATRHAGYPDKPAGMERGDLAKIVITKDRSGRTIRCENEADDRECWRGHDERNVNQNRRREELDERKILQQYRYDRRVYTPPKDAKEVENGVITHYTNESDLPMTSKTLQERVQARLKAIERRHQQEGAPVTLSPSGGALESGDHPFAAPNSQPPLAAVAVANSREWRGGFDRRSSGHPPPPAGGGGGAYRGGGGGGGYYGNRGRGNRGGGARWRGQWDDWRCGRRAGGWQNREHRFDDRRHIGADEARRKRSRYSSGVARNRPLGGTGNAVERSRSRSSRRSPVSRSQSASRSPSASRTSYSRSNSRSPSPSPVPGGAISRARVRTPLLSQLVNPVSETEEQMADVEKFVAQLKARRQMQQEMSASAALPTPIGPVEMPSASNNF